MSWRMSFRAAVVRRRKKDVCLHQDCENSEDSRLVGDDRVKRVRSNGQISNSKAVCFCLASGGTAIAKACTGRFPLSILNNLEQLTKKYQARVEYTCELNTI